MEGKLYLVATPIGNLEDITLRAIRILKEVDIIVAEDTRHTLKLLNHLEISKPLISYQRHSDEKRINEIIEKIIEGKNNCNSKSRISANKKNGARSKRQ